MRFPPRGIFDVVFHQVESSERSGQRSPVERCERLVSEIIAKHVHQKTLRFVKEKFLLPFEQGFDFAEIPVRQGVYIQGAFFEKNFSDDVGDEMGFERANRGNFPVVGIFFPHSVAVAENQNGDDHLRGVQVLENGFIESIEQVVFPVTRDMGLVPPHGKDGLGGHAGGNRIFGCGKIPFAFIGKAQVRRTFFKKYLGLVVGFQIPQIDRILGVCRVCDILHDVFVLADFV